MTAATKPPSLQGRTLGEFVLGDLLDEGGFGKVYRAEQRGLARPAVVKVIRRSLLARREAVERFSREARLASQFDHPYAAHVYAFGIEPDGVMWIAMELVKGAPLDDLLRRFGPLPLDRFVPLFERLCEVVQSAHDQGIVHRDIKPSNVMVVARAGRLMPKLLDFGIAKLVGGPSPAPVDWPGTAAQDAPAGEPVTAPASDGDPPPPPRRAAAGVLGFDVEQTLAASSQPDALAGEIPPPRFETASNLTRQGQLLGSPVYMAPEQWRDAAIAGPPADQYALALLAYEALTGTRGFAESSLEGLAHQHLHVPLRALPPQFPAAMYDALSRATDKLPELRFASVTELGAALRAAAGIGASELDAPLPMLPSELRIEWTSDAPRPIAEALAAIGSARTAMRCDERISALASLLARWIGALAIACRSRLGPIDDAAALGAELLVALRRRPLSHAEWLELAAALARGPAADAWPVPEMAEFLADPGAIAELCDLARGAGAGASDDGVARGAIERRIAQLAAALGRVAWLLDSTVAREVSDGLELWMGLRSDDRAIQRAASDASGALVLLDGYGARLVRLSPVFEVAPPVPGEADELFVLAGPGRGDAGARFVSHPRGFERESDAAWDWLAGHVLATAPEAAAPRDDDPPPYPGLLAYTAEDRASFVGRERDAEELINRLRTAPLVAVIGPSGIGKTSFLAAGVVPALPGSWHAETIRPGGDPLGALAAIADRVDAPPYREAASAPARTPAGIAAALAALADKRGATLVVIVDQAEELFTLGSTPEVRAAFAEAIAAAAAHPRIRIAIAMRDDFLCRADELPAWRGRLGACVQLLRVPGRDDLERIAAAPAKRRGYDFDDDALPAEIAAEVADRPGALPLLAFTAATLWDQRDRHFHRLTRATYERIGGVGGALVRHADGVLDQMPAPDRRLVRLAFRRLLSADGTRAVIGRGELVHALGGAAAAAVIDRLLAARLLVSRDDDAVEPGDASSDGTRIEVIHEILATAWPRLAAWRREDAERARLAEQLAASARHWDERGRPADLLWRGAALADLVRWQAAGDGGLTERESAFARASIAAATRTRRRRLGAVVAAFAVLLAAASGLVIANREIAAQRTAAVARLAGSFEDRGRVALADGDAARAMLYLAEAGRLGARGPGFDVLAAQAAVPLGAGLEILGHSEAGISALTAGDRPLTIDTELALMAWTRGAPTRLAEGIRRATAVGELAIALSRQGDVAAIDREGKVRWRAPHAVTDTSSYSGLVGSAPAGAVIAFGKAAAILDLATGQVRGELAASGGHASALAIDPAGARIALGDTAGTVTIWDASATRIASCDAHAAAVRALAFSPDGTSVVSGSDDGEVRICDPQTGRARHRLIGHSQPVLAVDVSPDGELVASAGRDGKPRLWDARTGLLVAALDGHRGAVFTVAFSPGGDRVLTLGSDDGTVRLWNREGMALGSLQGHGGRLYAGYWDRDGRHAITAGSDGAIRRWDTDLAVTAAALRAHTGPIANLALSRDARWALTAGADNSAALWDLSAHRPVVRLPLAARAQQVGLSADATTAFTVDLGRSCRLWSMPDGAPRTALAGEVTAAAYAPGSGDLITAGGGSVRWWTAAGADRAASVPLDYTAEQLVFDPSGRWLFVRGAAGAIAVIDLASRTLATRLTIHDPHALAVAAGATRVAIADGRAIRLWQLGTWQPAGELVGHRNVVSDLWYVGDQLISTADDGALVWSDSGPPRARLSDGERVVGLAASADGALIATASNDGVVRIWDAASHRRLLVLPGHRMPTFVVQIAPDGGTVVSGGRDGRLVRWQLDRRPRPAAALADLVRCRVPLRLDGDAALPRELDFDDPSCGW